jgi:hypothetical protein
VRRDSAKSIYPLLIIAIPIWPDNLFNPDAKRIVRELDVAVMDALKEMPSDMAITQMLAEWQ